MPDGNQIPFDYLGAVKAGYSDDEIQSFLKQKYDFNFDIGSAKKSGYSDNEISSYITNYQPTKKKDVGISPTTSNGNGLQSDEDPVKTILAPKLENYRNAANDFYTLNQRNVSTSQGAPPIMPTKIGEEINPIGEFTKAKQERDAASSDLLATKNAVKQKMFSNGSDATKYLTNKILKTGAINPNNETDQLAVEKKNDYDNLLKTVSSSPNIEQAAISDRLANDETFKKQYQALQKENLPLPNSVIGETVAGFMAKHGNDLEALSKEHPEIKNDYQDSRDNILTKYPDYGISVVANDISQAREKLGYNSSAANFHTGTFDKHNDQIAKTLSPQEQEIWNNNKDAITNKIDTGGMLNRFEENIEGGWNNTKDLFKRVTFQNTKGERISDEMAKEATSVNNGEQGWKKGFGTAAGFAGTIGYMAAGGNLLGGIGVNPTIADATTNVGTFAEDFMRQGEMKYPDNTAKALASGVANTLAFAALSPLKAGKVTEALGKITPELETAIQTLPENATANTARQALSNAFEKGIKNWATGTTEMGSLTLFNQGLDKVMGLNQQTYEKYHRPTELSNVVNNMAIGMAVPSLLVGAGEFASNKIVPNSDKISINDQYQTMKMGTDEGKDETKAARELMKQRFSQGDVPMDGDNGTGETGKDFVGRTISQWESDKNSQPKNTTIVTHSSVLKAIKAWESIPEDEKPKSPNNFTPEQWKTFSDTYNKESTDNGDLETFKGANGDIHVIRHGQTVDNEANKFRSGNTNLTAKGEQQTADTGKELKDKTDGDVPKIISSNLPRAIHSSNIINDELGGTTKTAEATTETAKEEPQQTKEIFNEELPLNIKYKSVKINDLFTGEEQEMSASKGKRMMEKQHNILDKLINCLT